MTKVETEEMRARPGKGSRVTKEKLGCQRKLRICGYVCIHFLVSSNVSFKVVDA